MQSCPRAVPRSARTSTSNAPRRAGGSPARSNLGCDRAATRIGPDISRGAADKCSAFDVTPTVSTHAARLLALDKHAERDAQHSQRRPCRAGGRHRVARRPPMQVAAPKEARPAPGASQPTRSRRAGWSAAQARRSTRPARSHASRAWPSRRRAGLMWKVSACTRCARLRCPADRVRILPAVTARGSKCTAAAAEPALGTRSLSRPTTSQAVATARRSSRPRFYPLGVLAPVARRRGNAAGARAAASACSAERVKNPALAGPTRRNGSRCGRQEPSRRCPPPTAASSWRHRRVAIVGCPFAVAAVATVEVAHALVALCSARGRLSWFSICVDAGGHTPARARGVEQSTRLGVWQRAHMLKTVEFRTENAGTVLVAAAPGQ